MTHARIIIIALAAAVALWLAPGIALAHGSGGHAADPNLHVDAALEDCSVQFSSELSQGAFRRFAREFGSLGAFKLMAPPTTLGQWGFSIGVEQIFFSVEQHSDAWNDTFAHPDSYHELGSDLAFPKIRARLGITDDLDLGIFYTEQPKANYGWIGLEGKYGLLKQSETMPISLALRGAYTKTLFVEDMDMHALTLDVSAGRTFWDVLTPYVGLGTDMVLARETSDVVDLDTEAPIAPHAIAGLEVRFWHVALGAETHVAAVNSFEVQAAAVF